MTDLPPERGIFCNRTLNLRSIKAIGYDMPGIQVDGNDVVAVYRATREALERAREGQGPTLIEALTYRLMMHTTADDPTRYRTEQESQEWWSKEGDRFNSYDELASEERAETAKFEREKIAQRQEPQKQPKQQLLQQQQQQQQQPPCEAKVPAPARGHIKGRLGRLVQCQYRHRRCSRRHRKRR